MDREQIVKQVAENTLPQQNIKEFIDTSFIEVLVSAGKEPHETQARATITGDTFELCICELFNYYYPSIHYERNVSLEGACMSGSSGADFVIYDDTGEISAVIEAKGSADMLHWPDGTVQEPARPGLQRSDTMKKAVCQAYQVSQLDSNPLFFILTSHKPESGSAKCVYDLATGDIIDKVADVTKKSELTDVVELIE